MTKLTLRFALCTVAILATMGCRSHIRVKDVSVDPGESIWGNNTLNANTSLYERCLQRQKGHPNADELCESQAHATTAQRRAP